LDKWNGSMDMTRPWPDSQPQPRVKPNPLDAVSRITWPRSGPVNAHRINDFQARNEPACFWNGKSWQLVITR